MINEVTIEGIIVKAWKYTDDLLFRVAIYRDPDLPQKASATDVHDAADYITIRVVKGSLGAPVSLEKGQHIRVHGFLQSRDYDETLADFLKDARGAEMKPPEGIDPQALKAQRATTEVVARRIIRVSNGASKR